MAQGYNVLAQEDASSIEDFEVFWRNGGMTVDLVSRDNCRMSTERNRSHSWHRREDGASSARNKPKDPPQDLVSDRHTPTHPARRNSSYSTDSLLAEERQHPRDFLPSPVRRPQGAARPIDFALNHPSCPPPTPLPDLPRVATLTATQSSSFHSNAEAGRRALISGMSSLLTRSFTADQGDQVAWATDFDPSQLPVRQVPLRHANSLTDQRYLEGELALLFRISAWF